MKKQKLEWLIRGIWISLLFVGIFLLLFPVSTGIVRLATVIVIFSISAVSVYLFWKNFFLRVLLIIVLFVFAGLCFLPGRAANTEQLRNTYIQSLQKYEGVKYVWGGENKLGIDCSGLVREGFINANVKLGIKELNPALIRKAFFIWWYDCSADALGKEYRGMTMLVEKASSLDKLDYKNVLPGDIVVAAEGYHTFVYLGNDTWMEASPDKGKVVKITTEDKLKEWTNVAVNLMRWVELK